MKEFDKKLNPKAKGAFLDKYQTKRFAICLILGLLAVTAFSTKTYAQFTKGRLVVVQTAGTVSKGNSPITLQEYKTDGTLGTSVALPATGSTPIQMAAGSGGSEGFLAKSPDGTFVTVAGYSTAAAPGSVMNTATPPVADITSTSAASTPRIIFKVDAQGNATQVVASSSANTSSFTANDIRGAASDGTNFWAFGASGSTDGINYYGPGTPAVLAVGAKAYGLHVFNGQAYFSTQKVITGITPTFGIYALGSGLPTSGTVTPVSVINTGSSTPTDFSFNSTSDVCYIAINATAGTNGLGIQKWTKTAGVWSFAYTLPVGSTDSTIGAFALEVDYTGTNPIVYATTTESNTVGNRIIKIIDTGAASTATTLVQAAANTWFHGISFAPTCPQPVQPAAFTASTANVNFEQTAIAYSVANDPIATSYTWTYTGNGATINGTGNNVTVDFAANATNGVLNVTASNACGTSLPLSLPIAINGAMRITEFMYSGQSIAAKGEFVEFTNVGSTPVDMTGWKFDNITANPAGTAAHDLSAFGIVKPGESVIVTESDPTAFRTTWGLCSGIKIVGPYTTDTLGRSDAINLYNGTTLVDHLVYNDQATPAGSGGPRTQYVSAHVNAAGLGQNIAADWTLSALSDAEASFKSTTTPFDTASPGKSTLATVAYDPCAVVNTPPTIVISTTTSDYIDGGVTTPIVSPYSVSATANDPTDPATTSGIDFTIGDAETAVENLTVTVASSNTAVVSTVGIALTGTGASRNIKITPAGVGFANITLTVNDGTANTVFTITYAASMATTPSTVSASTVWHTGISDASDAIAIDDNYFATADDEVDVVNVYSRQNSGLPVVSFNMASRLNLPNLQKPEVDFELAAKSPVSGTVYFGGSMSTNSSSQVCPDRDRLFATNMTGTGAATTFSFGGYTALRDFIKTWGDSYGYDFTSSAADGVDSKTIGGFAAEGMTFGPDKTTLYIGMRSPLVPMTNRTKAVIVPITNFETWFNSGNQTGTPTFDAPIELDLGGRGVRDLMQMSNGTYIIIAGSWGGDAVSAIFKWTGNRADAPVRVESSADGILNMEGVMEVYEDGNLSLSKLEIVSDGGDDDNYNDGNEAKSYVDLNLRKFRTDILTSLDLSAPVPGGTLAAQQFDATHLRCYPNPVSEVLTVTNSSAISAITVFNILGQQVLSANPNTMVTTINMNHLPAGTYLMQVQSEGKTDVVKLVKN